eukprot:PRCOL_00002972-RA
MPAMPAAAPVRMVQVDGGGAETAANARSPTRVRSATRPRARTTLAAGGRKVAGARATNGAKARGARAAGSRPAAGGKGGKSGSRSGRSGTTSTGGKRRSHQRWSMEETTALVDGVERFGLGKWAEIKKHTFDETSGRTPVDLKDKWRNLSKALAKAAGDAATQRLETEYSPELMQRVRDLIPGNEGGSRARARGGASGSGGAAAVSRAANGGADAAGRRKRQRKPAAGAVATAAPKAARGLADEDARGGPGGGAGGTAGSMNEVFAQPLLAPHAADVHTAEQLLMPTAGVNGMVDPAMSFILPSI